MKAILMSIQPKWLEKILNGEKTVEIRKTMPKCELPIDVYLYCSKGDKLFKALSDNGIEYLCNETTEDWILDCADSLECVSGKVVAKFTLRGVDTIATDSLSYYAEKACFKPKELDKYLGVIRNSNFYHIDWGFAWHISDLVIFDKPIDLGRFTGTCNVTSGKPCGLDSKCNRKYRHKCLWDNLTRPPRSWQYVEVE